MHMKYLVRIHLASRVVVLLCVAVSSYSADETCKSNTFTKSSAAPTVTQKRDESDGMRGMKTKHEGKCEKSQKKKDLYLSLHSKEKSRFNTTQISFTPDKCTVCECFIFSSYSCLEPQIKK